MLNLSTSNDIAANRLIDMAHRLGLLATLEAAVTRHICDRAAVTDPAVRLALALAVRAPRLGDVCFAPATFDPATELRRRATDKAEARAETLAVEIIANDPSAESLDVQLRTEVSEPDAEPDAEAVLPGDGASHLTLPPDIVARLMRTPLVMAATDRPVDIQPHDPLAVAPRKPFIVDTTAEPALVYTDRWFAHEARLAAHIAARQSPSAATALPPAVLPWFHALFPEALSPPPTTDRHYPWAAFGAATALTSRLTLLTGGPGTGKTFAVRKLLLLHRIFAALGGAPAPRVALAAPTGKASARLRESLIDQLDGILETFSEQMKKAAAGPLVLPAGLDFAALRATITDTVPTTLHRLLRIHPDRPTRPHFGPSRHLPHDLVVIDEASMIDLPMMTRLFDALAPETSLVILGDHHQLASVEAGAVLADLVALAGPSAPPPLPIITLRGSRRFNDATTIGRFAQALTAEPFDATAAIALVAEPIETAHEIFRRLRPPEQAPVLAPRVPVPAHTPPAAVVAFGDALDAAIREGFLPYLLRLHAGPLAGETTLEHHQAVLAAFDRFRILCGHRGGALGVRALNERIPTALAAMPTEALPPAARPAFAAFVASLGATSRRTPADPRFPASTATQPFWPGRPILVTRNDPTLGRQNGDIGLVVDRVGIGTRNDWRIAFPGSEHNPVEYLAASLLPPHETAFAMTIHKSQGSQYRHVMVVLPERESPIVTRELVYTAVTRMTHDVTLVASDRVLGLAIQQTVQRTSGLGRRFSQ